VTQFENCIMLRDLPLNITCCCNKTQNPVYHAITGLLVVHTGFEPVLPE